jgi:hypothetical protein
MSYVRLLEHHGRVLMGRLRMTRLQQLESVCTYSIQRNEHSPEHQLLTASITITATTITAAIDTDVPPGETHVIFVL